MKFILPFTKIKKESISSSSFVEIEASDFINKIISSYHTYADIHQVEIKMNKYDGSIQCRINEEAIAAALQHLIYTIIKDASPNSCINIGLTLIRDYWGISISGCQEAKSKFLKKLSSTHILKCYSNLRPVKKIIRLHGGRIISNKQDNIFTYHLFIPLNCHLSEKEESSLIHSCRTKQNLLMDSQKALLQQRTDKLWLNDPSLDLPITLKNDNESITFLENLQMLFESKISSDKYTIDMLCVDMGMCRTNLYNKIKDITGCPPAVLIDSFKMVKARELLKTNTVRGVSGKLDFCDPKYFGKKFKSYFNISPSKYIEELREKGMYKPELEP